MIRTFHPIGQGAFYTEEFNGLKIVYDCGSDNIDLIEKEIRSVFEKAQSIDAVFISHLHSDHVNGLEYLLNYCDVQKLFLPLLQEDVKINSLIQNHIQGSPSPFVIQLIENPEAALANRGNVKLILVEQTNNESQINPESSALSIDEEITSDMLTRNTKMNSSKIPDWVFIPFNFRQPARSDDFKNELKNRNVNFGSLAEFKSHWSNNVDKRKIIEAYKSVPGSLNTNSMTLYSGPDLKDSSQYFIEHYCRNIYPRCYCGEAFAGCLYFGDYEAKGEQKWDQLISHYGKYWEAVGTVQVPHHGSRHNYNREINKNNPKISIMSAGFANRYRHPHASTARDISVDCGCPLIVTENVGSRVMIEIIGPIN